MYQISRALYRSLIDEVPVEDRPRNDEIRLRLLEACEATVHRLATDRFYFACPALFREIRWCFPGRGAAVDELMDGVPADDARRSGDGDVDSEPTVKRGGS